MHMPNLKNKAVQGFTLIEVLLSLSVMAIIAGMGAPVYHSYERQNDLDIATGTIVQYLRRAAISAEAMAGDAPWGVSIVPGKATLFRGATFATRNQNFDEIFTLSNTITASGLSEIVFTKMTGMPETTGSITLTTSAYASRTININSQGMVAF